MAWCIVGAYMLIWGRHWFLDLAVYKSAGHALLQGQDPYGLTYSVHHLPYTYTPFALFVFGPMSVVPFPLLATLWWLATASALTGTIYLCVRTASRAGRAQALAVAALLAAVSSLALEPVRSNMDYGQINVLLMWAIVRDICKPTRGRGVLIGLAAAIKLTPLVYFVYFLVKKDWRGLVTAVSTFVVSVGLGWLALWHESDQFWFHLVLRPGRTGAVGSPSNQSWEGALFRAGVSSAGQRWLWFVAAAVTVAAAGIAAWQLVRAGRTFDSILVLALAELLASPVSWSHHWCWVALVPVALYANRGGSALLQGGLVLLLLVAIAAPYWWTVPSAVQPATENSLLACGAIALAAAVFSAVRKNPESAAVRT